MRYRRLHVYNTDPKRAQGDLWATDRQDSAGAAAMVGSPVGDANYKISFFSPQYVSHWSLWTSSEPNGTQALHDAFGFAC